VYHTLFPSYLTPPSFCGNKTQIKGKRNIQWLPDRSPVWFVKSQTTRLWWSSAGDPVKTNNLLREITEVSTSVVAQSPDYQGRFSHLSAITEKEEG